LTAPSPNEDPVPSGSAPPDLDAVRRSDATLDALAERDTATLGAAEDPVLGLLGALAEDVDYDYGIPSEVPTRPIRRRRTGPRTIVALGVSSVVLATTGVAAAGGFEAFEGRSTAEQPKADHTAGRAGLPPLAQARRLPAHHPAKPAESEPATSPGAPEQSAQPAAQPSASGSVPGSPPGVLPSQIVLPLVPSAEPTPDPAATTTPPTDGSDQPTLTIAGGESPSPGTSPSASPSASPSPSPSPSLSSSSSPVRRAHDYEQP
jgi:hypothetical protein